MLSGIEYSRLCASSTNHILLTKEHGLYEQQFALKSLDVSVAAIYPESHSDLNSELREALLAMIAVRRARHRYFASNLFGEPAWNMLLDLALSRLTGRNVDVTSACIASGSPTTTGLRALAALEASGHAVRRSDPTDGRRFFVVITDKSFAQVKKFIESVSQSISSARMSNP